MMGQVELFRLVILPTLCSVLPVAGLLPSHSTVKMAYLPYQMKFRRIVREH